MLSTYPATANSLPLYLRSPATSFASNSPTRVSRSGSGQREPVHILLGWRVKRAYSAHQSV
jgi:hypothetical protein